MFGTLNTLDYVCDYCDRLFTRKFNLQTHIENCHLNTSFACDICGTVLGSPAGLQVHYTRGHNRNGEPFPECDICGRIYTRKHSIMTHMMNAHLEIFKHEIRCKLCEKTFTSLRNLKRHVAHLHNPKMSYPTCNECHKVFRGKYSLITHIQTAHTAEKDAIKCHICDKVYTNNRNLKRHMETHGEKETFKCDICPKRYSSNQSLRRHYRNAHCSDDVEELQCDFCEKTIVGRDNLDLHVRCYHKEECGECEVEIDEYDYACESCGRCFTNEPLLRQHVKADHSFKTFYKYCRESLIKQFGLADSEGPKKRDMFYNCEFCNNAFTSVYELKDHMKINHDREYCLSTCNVCFAKFYSQETMVEHKKICMPPPNVNSCSLCDKLFTDKSSLEFHTRIFHPQAQIADSNISSTNTEDSPEGHFKCMLCDRVYYSDRSLKHHIKLKHTTDEAVECELCGKICSNKYYLASHKKIVHSNETWSKCDYCEKQFKSKRNIRRHIEYTHLGMQRYKCIECETLFKEKRSLRKHVRTKHPNSTVFPQCHFCYKRFESAKSCKIHLKLLHSFNMNTYPCDLCSVSFRSKESLDVHIQSKHLAEDEIYKCEECNLVFKGQESFDHHNEFTHVNILPNIKQKVLPRCIICMKDFSTRKTLKRHIKKFHDGFDVDELATFGSRKRTFNVECDDCLKAFNDDYHFSVYQSLKHVRDTIVFTCETCASSYTCLEFAIQRYKMTTQDMNTNKGKMILSELCTTEMSEDEESFSGFGSMHEMMEPESTTNDLMVKMEPDDFQNSDVKDEPLSDNEVKAEPM